MSQARAANLLGAIALGLADNIFDTAKGRVAHGGCTPAALSVIPRTLSDPTRPKGKLPFGRTQIVIPPRQNSKSVTEISRASLRK
jgi:hypothetical protein